MIDFKNVYKSYPSQDLLVDTNLRINPGERVGLVGPNGAGKSTMFFLITGEVLPDKGTVSVPANHRLAYLRQQLPDDAAEKSLLDYVSDAIPELNQLMERIHCIEAVIPDLDSQDAERELKELGNLQTRFESLGGYNIRVRAKIVLGGLGFLERRFGDRMSEFSGGWQMRASLARVLVAEPEIMLLDEPSNYLDIPAIEWLQRYLKDFEGTLLLISHDRYLLKSLTNITVEIASGIVTRFSGNYDYYVRESEMRLKSLEAAKRNQDIKKEKIERFAERFGAKNTKATLVKSRLKALEKMEDILIPRHHSTAGIRLPHPPHSGAEMVRLEDASLSYDGGKTFVLENLDLRIERGQKIALAGYNGTGKTTLLKMLAGVLPLSSGKRTLGHKVVVGYQAQEFADILPPEKSLYDILQAVVPSAMATKRIRTVLGAFGFSGDDADKKCKVLSGGEKIRLAFARIFINPPNILILDEPTTHLDIHARESLQNALKKYEGTVCIVSHDIEFVRNLADIIIAMTPPGITRYCGNYDYYLEKNAAREISSESPKEKNISNEDPRQRRKERAERRQGLAKVKSDAEKEVRKFEKQIEQLETERLEIARRIENNDTGIDFYKVNKRLLHIEEDLKGVSDKWVLAASMLEEIQKEYDAIHQ